MKDKAAFLLRADEASEMLADQAFTTIRAALLMEGYTNPIPDPYTISHKNLRLLIRAAFKAGAVFGMEEMIQMLEEI